MVPAGKVSSAAAETGKGHAILDWLAAYLLENNGSLKKLHRLTREALDNGTSLVVFAEGSRTLDGRVQPFRQGIFRMVRDMGYPIVPVSMVGSFEFHRKGSHILYPSKIVVHIHDTIETEGLGLDKEQAEALRQRVQAIVSKPVEEALEHLHNWCIGPGGVNHE